MGPRMERHMQEHDKKKNPIFLYGLLTLLLLAITAAATFYWFADSQPLTLKRAKRNQTSGQAAPSIQEGKVNILVLGVDKRVENANRSDTMLVVTVDIKTKETSLLSIPRDSRVKIPGRKWDKVNHAYAYGGQKLAQRTVEELLGIPIDYYVIVDFSGFSKLVDAVGGVNIDVEKRMYYTDPYDDLVIDLQPGMQHMDGKTAIQYVRYRDGDGDIGRIARQQKFLKAMLDEVTSPSVIMKLPGMIKEVSNMIQTDLSAGDMLGLAKLLNDAKQQGLKTDILPGTPMDLHEISYWVPDIMALRDYVAHSQGFKPDDKYLAAAKRLAAESEDSVQHEIEEMKLEAEKAALEKKAGEQEDKDGQDVSIIRDPRTGLPIKQAGEKKPSTATKPTGPVKPVKPDAAGSRVRVAVLNGSGDAAAAAKMAETLRRQGFDVVSVSNTRENRYTAVISHTTSSAVVNKLTNLPFNYVLQVTRDESKSSQVTVIVGKDYVRR